MMASVPEPGAKKLGVEGPGSAPGAAPAAAGTQQASAKPSTPAPTRRKLSAKEIKELTAQLEAKYRQWLQIVDMIVTDDERQVFLQIGDNYQKDKFIEAFWKRRSIDSQGLRTDFQRVYTRRIEIAQNAVQNLHNDRAKIFVIDGPRRDHPDRLPGHLRAGPDLVLRAARVPEEQGLPRLLPAVRARGVQALAPARRPGRPAGRRQHERGRPHAGAQHRRHALRRVAHAAAGARLHHGRSRVGPDGHGRREQALPAPDRRDRGRGPDPDDDDGAGGRVRPARRRQARAVPGAALEQDRRGPVAARAEG